MGIATQYEGGLRFEGDQMYITTGSSTIMTIKSGGTIQLPQYSAGLLQTDASGNVSVDTSSYLTSYTETDTLNSVVGRGASTTSAITVGGITSGNASLNGTVQLGSFNGNNEDQWPIVQWYRDTTNNWDEGLIKASSNRGFFSTSHFGIHFNSSRAFGFFTSSWTKVLGISSSKVLSEVDFEIGSGETLIHGELRLGTHPVHSGYTGLWNTEASTTTTQQYLIISSGTDTYINGDNVYIRAGNNSNSNELKITTSGATIGGNTVWHAGNDGSGTGLDADTLDGQHGSSFLRSNASDSFDGTLSWGGSAGSDAFDLNNSDIEDARGVRAREFTQLASGVPRNNLGDPTVTEMALFDSQFRCMTDLSNNYNDLTDLRFYVQTTSASEWEEVTTYSDDQKRRFLRTNNSSVQIPNTAYKFRVEFNASGYTFANAMYFYWSSQSHSSQVHIWKQRASDDQWFQHTSSTNTVSSWPGHLWMPFSTIPWLEDASSTSTGHYHKVRVEFIPNWSGSATYGDRPIALYGGQIWGGYPSGRRTPHYYDQNGKLFTWGDFEVNGKLHIDTRDANTSSTTALVMNGNEVEQRTLGSAAFSTSTDFVAVSGDQMTGNLEIKRTVPVIVLNDSDATNTTNLTAYISLQTNGTEKGWVGYGGSGNSDLTLKNNDGRVVLNGSSSYVTSSLDVSGVITNSGGAKLEIQNSTDGGSSRGIYMWTSDNTDWGIYMSTAGDGKALNGGAASAGIDGATSHAIRFRVNDNSAQAGFIWENNSNETLMQLNGGTEKLYTKNAIYPSNQTTDYVDSTRIQNWQTAYGWGDHGLSAQDKTDIGNLSGTNTGDQNFSTLGGATRTNYTLKFQPPTSSYAGFQFLDTSGNGAGYFLIRGTSDNDVYTAEGITLVADAGWLTLAQRTTSDKGIKFMTGATAATRMTIANDGDININNSLTVGADLGVNGAIKDSLYKHTGSANWQTKKYVRSVGITGADIGGSWVQLSRVVISSTYEKVTIKYTINGYDDVSSGVEAIDVRYENGASSQENHQMAWYSTDDHANLFSEVRSIRSSSSGLSNTYDLYVKMAGDWRDNFTVVAESWTTHGDSASITYITAAGSATAPSAGSNDINNSERRWYTENAYMYLGGNRVYTTGDFSTSDFATASHSHSAATTSAAGFMSSADKTKLDGVATNADVTPSWVPGTDPSYLTAETFGSSDVVMSLSGTDVTAGESITLAGGLSYSGTTLTSANDNTTYTAGTGLTLTNTTFSVTANTYATAAQGTAADAALPKAGGTMSGTMKVTGSIIHEFSAAGGYVPFPKGAMYTTATNAHTGAVRIQIPVGDVYDMVKFVVEIFDYTSSESVTLNIAGYINGGTNQWVNQTVVTLADSTAKDYKVRFGKSDSKATVYIGETDSTWSYPQIIVRDFYVGFNGDVDRYDDGWNIDFATSFENVEETYSDNLPAADWSRLKGKPSTFAPTIGTTATTAMAGNTTTISSAQATAITANTAKVTDTGIPAILSDGSVPSLNTNITEEAIRDLIGAGTGDSNLAIGTTATTAMAGNTTIPTNNNQLTNGAGYITSYVDTQYSAGSGLDLTSTTFSVEPDLRDGITHVGKDANNYITFDSTNGRIDFYAGGVFVARMESDGDLHIKGDVIAYSDIFS